MKYIPSDGWSRMHCNEEIFIRIGRVILDEIRHDSGQCFVQFWTRRHSHVHPYLMREGVASQSVSILSPRIHTNRTCFVSVLSNSLLHGQTVNRVKVSNYASTILQTLISILPLDHFLVDFLFPMLTIRLSADVGIHLRKTKSSNHWNPYMLLWW